MIFIPATPVSARHGIVPGMGSMNTLYIYWPHPNPLNYALELRIEGSNVSNEFRYRSDISVNQVQNTCSMSDCTFIYGLGILFARAPDVLLSGYKIGPKTD